MRRTVGGLTIPGTRYARSGDISIAYQVFGDGDVTVLAIPPAAQSVDQIWDWPPVHHYFERWAAFARVAHFDKRGTGQSDRVDGATSLEERMDDLRAVMDAVGFEQATLYGLSEGGPLAMLFAATYPERTNSLILQGASAGGSADRDCEFYVEQAVWDELIDAWAEGWGTPATLTAQAFCPSQIGDAHFIEWMNRYERSAATPKSLRQLMDMNRRIDVRHIAETISCPTLVLHASRDPLISIDRGRWLADHIPGARFVEYDSGDHFPLFVAVDEQLDAIESFLTGGLLEGTIDRVLATVLFSNVVRSTERAATMGDAAWRALLDRHDASMAQSVAIHRGSVIKGTGDGFLATFDSPARAIRCSTEMHSRARSMELELRSGIHTGEVERRGQDIAGIGVHIGARVASLAGPDEIYVSSAVPPLVLGSGFEFDERGEHQLKGVPGDWKVYAVRTAGSARA